MPEIDTNEFEFSVLNQALEAFIAKYGQENLPAGFINLTKSFQTHNINIQDWNTLVIQIQQSMSNTNTCKEFLVTLTNFVKDYLSQTYTKEEINALLDYKADKANVWTKSESYSKADADAKFVTLATAQNISGSKTFLSDTTFNEHVSLLKSLATQLLLHEYGIKFSNGQILESDTDGIHLYKDSLTPLLHFTNTAIYPNGTVDLGIAQSYNRFRDLHITGSLKNNLRTIPVNNILDLAAVATILAKYTFSVLPETQANRNYTSDRQLADKGLVGSETTRATAAETGLDTRVTSIEHLIPEEAYYTDETHKNILADRNFVNSTVATATASFKGTYDIVDDLELSLRASNSDVAAALADVIEDEDENDYAYVQDKDLSGNTLFRRFKYTEADGWLYEYVLNNSSFTADEWAAIQSGATTELIQQIIKNRNNTAPLYDSTSTYDVGNYVIYNGDLYVCSTAITTAEAWNSAHWTQTTVLSELAKVPQYVDITIGTNEWSNNSVSKASGVLTLTNDDEVLAIPNGIQNDQYIRTFGVEIVSFNNATGVATFECMTTPTETINITLQILRR